MSLQVSTTLTWFLISYLRICYYKYYFGFLLCRISSITSDRYFCTSSEESSDSVCLSILPVRFTILSTVLSIFLDHSAEPIPLRNAEGSSFARFFNETKISLSKAI